jgi:hypothetical protein
MSINWAELRGLKNKQEIEAQLRLMVRTDTYGIGKGYWTLTEIINERSNVAESARNIIAGMNERGLIDNELGLKDNEGQPLRYTLRVVSRQACTDAKDGKGINNWNPIESKPENDNNEYCPNPEEPPQEGDRVWIKGNPIINDPVTGERLIKKYKMAMKARMEADLGRQIKPELAHFNYTKVPVDKKGCIRVSFNHAMQLLTTKGKRLVLPQFASGKRASEKERRITNWHFEEVPPNKQKKQRTKPSNPTGEPAAVAGME